MRNYFTSLLQIMVMILCFTACNSNQHKLDSNSTNFYELIVNDFSMQSYYLVLDVRQPNDSTYKILIQNADLWYIYNNVKKYSANRYITEVKYLLRNNEALTIDSNLAQKLSKYRLQSNCLNVMQLDADTIRMRYFDGGYLKYQFQSDKLLRDCLVYALFAQGVPIRNNDESGFLEFN